MAFFYIPRTITVESFKFIYMYFYYSLLIFLTNACKSSLSLNNKFKLINIFIIQENWLDGKHAGYPFHLKALIMCHAFVYYLLGYRYQLKIDLTKDMVLKLRVSVGELTWGSWVTMWQIVPLVSFLLTATFPA